MEIGESSILQINNAYLEGKISPVDVAEDILRKAEETKDSLNAFATVTADRAIDSAKGAAERIENGTTIGPLEGIPYNVKDLLHVEGEATTLSCLAYKDNVQTEDASIVKRLEKAGAVLIGKSHTGELALSASTDVGAYAPTRNPLNMEYVAGGSSAGCASAVAAGMSSFGIGTDQGGSCRIPACCCGVVGFKPTWGLVSYYGTAESSEFFDHLGILAKSAEDCAIVLSEIAGYDEQYWASYEPPAKDYVENLYGDVKGMVVAVPQKWVKDGTQPFVYDCYQRSLSALEEMGVELVDIDLDPEELVFWRQCHQKMLLAGAYSNHRDKYENTPELIGEEIKARLANGKQVPAWEYYRYVKKRREVIATLHEKLKDIDAIVTPTLQITPPKLLQRVIIVDGKEENLYSRVTHFTWLGNFTGMPAITIPNGFDENNLPSGFQFIGKNNDEAKILQLANALEKAIVKY